MQGSWGTTGKAERVAAVLASASVLAALPWDFFSVIVSKPTDCSAESFVLLTTPSPIASAMIGETDRAVAEAVLVEEAVSGDAFPLLGVLEPEWMFSRARATSSSASSSVTPVSLTVIAIACNTVSPHSNSSSLLPRHDSIVRMVSAQQACSATMRHNGDFNFSARTLVFDKLRTLSWFKLPVMLMFMERKGMLLSKYEVQLVHLDMFQEWLGAGVLLLRLIRRLGGRRRGR